MSARNLEAPFCQWSEQRAVHKPIIGMPGSLRHMGLRRKELHGIPFILAEGTVRNPVSITIEALERCQRALVPGDARCRHDGTNYVIHGRQGEAVACLTVRNGCRPLFTYEQV